MITIKCSQGIARPTANSSIHEHINWNLYGLFQDEARRDVCLKNEQTFERNLDCGQTTLPTQCEFNTELRKKLCDFETFTSFFFVSKTV